MRGVLHLLVLLLLASLAGCLGGGEGDSSGSENGTAPTAVDITQAMPYASSVVTGDRYFVVSGLTPGSIYAIYAYSVTGDIALYGYVDSGFLLAICISNRPGTADEACSTLPDADGKIYIRVSGTGNFILKVMPAVVSEGTQTVPLDITTALPHVGSAGPVASSYYVVMGLTPGHKYTVSLASVLFNPELLVYQRKYMDYADCESANPVWSNESCELAANFEGKLYIEVESNNGATLSQLGSYFTINVVPASGSELYFEGYGDTPIDLTARLPYAGQINRYDSYYKITGLMPGTRYEMRMNNPSIDVQLWVFPSESFVGAICQTGYFFTLPARKSCVAQASENGELYVQVPYVSTAGTYALDITPAPVAEGSATVPDAIAAPYDGQVDTAASYYVINGLVPNWNYTVTASNASNPITVMVGSSTSLSPYADISTGRSNGSGSLYIKVDGSGTNGQGAWFNLNYAVANNPQGTLATPVDITSSSPASPFAGQVDNRTSYYTISGLAPGDYYMTHIGEYTDAVTVSVWDNASFSGSAKCSFIASPFSTSVTNHCLAPVPAGGVLYIQVVGPSAILGTQYTLWVAPSPLKSEGQGAPVTVSVGTPYAGKVSNYSTDKSSYYLVSGLPGAASYNVALSNTTDDVELYVYSDSGLTSELCRSLRKGLYDESCVATTVSGGGGSNKTLYIKVDAAGYPVTTYDGASYTLTITSGATPVVNEGASGAPLDITASLPYNGKVRATVSAAQSSYYKVTGLNASTYYAVVIENPTESVDLYVYSDAAFTTNLCTKTSPFEPINGACATLPNGAGELYIKTTSKYLSDSRYTIKVVFAPAATGALGAPVDLTGALPYTGQVSSGKSYYRVSGLTPAASYHVSLSKLTNSAQVAVYPDSTFASYSSQSMADDDTTSIVGAADASGILYIAADGFYSSGHGAFFELAALRPAPQSQGSVGSPVSITLKTPYAGQKTYLGAKSYYKITGLAPHSSHRVTLQNRTMSAWVKVYDNAGFTRELCYSGYSDYRTGCAAAANHAGEMFIEVGESGGYYDLYVP